MPEEPVDRIISSIRSKAGLDKTYSARQVPEGADTGTQTLGAAVDVTSLTASLERLTAYEIRSLLGAIEERLAVVSQPTELLSRLPTMGVGELQSLKSAVTSAITKAPKPSALVTALPALTASDLQTLLVGVQTRLTLVVDQTPLTSANQPDLAAPAPLSTVTTWFGQTFQVPFYINGKAGYFYLAPATIGTAGAQEVVVTNLDNFNYITVDMYGSDYLGATPQVHIAKVDSNGNLWVTVNATGVFSHALNQDANGNVGVRAWGSGGAPFNQDALNTLLVGQYLPGTGTPVFSHALNQDGSGNVGVDVLSNGGSAIPSQTSGNLSWPSGTTTNVFAISPPAGTKWRVWGLMFVINPVNTNGTPGIINVTIQVTSTGLAAGVAWGKSESWGGMVLGQRQAFLVGPSGITGVAGTFLNSDFLAVLTSELEITPDMTVIASITGQTVGTTLLSTTTIQPLGHAEPL